MPATEETKNNHPQTTHFTARCSRRDFLRLMPVLGASLTLAACGGVTPLTPPNNPQLEGGAGAASQNADWVPFQVIVDKEKCTGCEECVGNCPASVLELVDGKAEPVNPEECLGCEVCIEVCDFDAIQVFET